MAPWLHGALLLLTAASVGLVLLVADKHWRAATNAARHGAAGASGRARGAHAAAGAPLQRERGGREVDSPARRASGRDALPPPLLRRRREVVFALLASNQVAVGWARALYTPFLAWNLYGLPLVLALAGVGKVVPHLPRAPPLLSGRPGGPRVLCRSCAC
jgi:hypothetical protein